VTRDEVRALLHDVATGARTAESALEALAAPPVAALATASIDHHRALRQGVPEVVLGEGKRTSEVVDVLTRLAERHGRFLVTRASTEQSAAVTARYPDAVANARAGTVRWRAPRREPPSLRGPLAIVTAGTSDLAVAEECAETALACDIEIERIVDVGVAGLHRLLPHLDVLSRARVIVVVAGMDGALPSVIGGLVRVPVVAVPTSVGYGAAFDGLAALLGMLNSCAAGVVVTNIDNGFGAAMAAARHLLD
jgi:NCAIR mutase (PurE)-related protein